MARKAVGPLYKEIADTLVSRLKKGTYNNGLLPSESALGAEFATSRITVRSALKQLERLGLIDSVQGKGRRIRGAGLPVQPIGGRVVRIRCVVESAQLPAYQQAMSTISRLAIEHNRSLSFSFFHPGGSEAEADQAADVSGVDGVIGIGLGITAPGVRLARRIQAAGTPVVFLGAEHPGLLDRVRTDDFAGGGIAGAHLRDHGHDAVAILIPSDLADRSFAERADGMVAALGPAARVWRLPMATDADDDGVELQRLLTSADRLIAVFMTADHLMRGLAPVLGRLGHALPGPISVVGFDNMINTRQEYRRAVDSMDHPWSDLATCAYRRLDELLAGHPPGRAILLRPRLVIHGTVARREAPFR